MHYTKYMGIVLFFSVSLTASMNKTNKDRQKINMRSTCFGIVAVGVFAGLDNIGKFPLRPSMKAIGILPVFFATKKISSHLLELSAQIKMHT